MAFLLYRAWQRRQARLRERDHVVSPALEHEQQPGALDYTGAGNTEPSTLKPGQGAAVLSRPKHEVNPEDYYHFGRFTISRSTGEQALLLAALAIPIYLETLDYTGMLHSQCTTYA
jgi:hypothetical protein